MSELFGPSRGCRLPVRETTVTTTAMIRLRSQAPMNKITQIQLNSRYWSAAQQ